MGVFWSMMKYRIFQPDTNKEEIEILLYIICKIVQSLPGAYLAEMHVRCNDDTSPTFPSLKQLQAN